MTRLNWTFKDSTKSAIDQFAILLGLAVVTIFASASAYAANAEQASASSPSAPISNHYGQWDQEIQAFLILDHPKLLKAEEPEAESSPSSPPLTTDDPGTPPKNGYEINLISACDQAHHSSDCEHGVDAAFGLTETVQFRISKSYVRAETKDDSGRSRADGVGPTDIGIKVRFYDHKGVQVATFPSWQLNDATRARLNDGTLARSEGESIYLPIIVSKELGKFTVVTNVGQRINLEHHSENSTFTGLAVGHAVDRDSRVMAEIASTQGHEGRRTDVRIGWIKLIFPKMSRVLKTSVFASLGKSIGQTDDGHEHTTILVGLMFEKQPE